uniref:EF-hand domain-containing protein n=1 Tax=Macrostomum lignano TaxID=282301 RepID=A0A1I8J9I5_9PLAT
FPSVCEVQYDAEEFRVPYRLPSSSGPSSVGGVGTRGGVGLHWLPRISRSGRLSVQLVEGYGEAFGYDYGYGEATDWRNLLRYLMTRSGRVGTGIYMAMDTATATATATATGDGDSDDQDRRPAGAGRGGLSEAGRQTRIQFNLTEQQKQQQVKRQSLLLGDRKSGSQLTYHSIYTGEAASSALGGSKSFTGTGLDSGLGGEEAEPPLEWIDDLRRWIEVREDTSYLSFVSRAQLGANPKSRLDDQEDEDYDGHGHRDGRQRDELCDRFLHHFNLAQERKDNLDASRRHQKRRQRPRKPAARGDTMDKSGRGKLWTAPPPPPPRPKPKPKRYAQQPPPPPPPPPKRRDSPEAIPTEPKTAVEVLKPPPSPPKAPPPPTPPPREPTPPPPPATPPPPPREPTPTPTPPPPPKTPTPAPSSHETEPEESEDEASEPDVTTEAETETTAKSTTEAESDASYPVKSEPGSAVSERTIEAPVKPPSPTPIVAPPPKVLRQIHKKVKIAPKKMVVQYTEKKVDVASAREENVAEDSDKEEHEDSGSSSFLTTSTPPSLPPVPEPAPHHHPAPMKPDSDVPLRPRIPREMYKRWGAKRINHDRELEAERARLAELRKQKAEEISSRLKKLIPSATMTGDGPLYEEYGWLAKFCILNRTNVPMFMGTFRAVDIEEKGFLQPDEVLLALKAVNSQLTEAEELYIFRVLEMCGYRLKAGADSKLFCIIAALSQRITSLDTWMRNAINEISFKILDMKLFLCKSLWESCVPDGFRTMNIDQLAIELLAGGVANKHIEEVRMRLGPTREFDLLDFLTYIPLFILLHTSIVDNPLSTTRDL